MSDAIDRSNTVRAHITQDDFGYWMMTLECHDGTLMLASYAAESPEHDILHALHPQEIGLPATTEFLVSQATVPVQVGILAWTKPAPRCVQGPYYVIQNGQRVN